MGFWQPLFFWIFALGAVVSSIAVLWFRNPLYSALSLITDFLCFAALYILLSGHVISVIQVLVYTGAIMVLFVFIIMLLNFGEDEIGPRIFSVHQILAVGAGIGLFAFIATSVGAIVDNDRVDEQRKMALSESDSPLVIATESRVPGLYADLSEAGLEKKYREKIEQWESGESTPATGKYPTFRPDRSFEIPPAMKPAEQGTVEEDDGGFGTIEPLSMFLVNRFVVPFEFTAILLLVGIIGAVIIAKKRI